MIFVTDGVEALQRIRDADEVLPVVDARAGVGELALGFGRREIRSAVDQPKALSAVEQNHTWDREQTNRRSSEPLE